MYAKCKTIEKGKASVTSSMIWGCQWDATLRWMQTSTNPEVAKFPTDSAGKGNFDSSSIIPTGSNSAYSVNNIYDMGGNKMEATIEANSTSKRVLRGGWRYDTAGRYPASSRYGLGPTGITEINNMSAFGCRSSLYVTPGANSN